MLVVRSTVLRRVAKGWHVPFGRLERRIHDARLEVMEISEKGKRRVESGQKEVCVMSWMSSSSSNGILMIF